MSTPPDTQPADEGDLVGTVHEHPDHPVSERWAATCVAGEVFTGHSEAEVRAMLLDHHCDPALPGWFNRCSTDRAWAQRQLDRLNDGAPPQHDVDVELAAVTTAELAAGTPVWRGPVPPPEHGEVWRSSLWNWSWALHVSGVFQSGALTIQADAYNERGLLQFLDIAFGHPDQISRVHLTLEPNTTPSPGFLSELIFDFDSTEQVAAAVLRAYGRDEQSYGWVSRGDAARPGVVLAWDSWNAAETRFPPGSFITLDALRRLAVAWAFGEGVLPPPCADWVSESTIAWF